MYHLKWLRLEVARLSVKKMTTKVLLILPLYVTLFVIWLRFRHVIKMMPENILTDEEFFDDTVDTKASM